MVVFWMMVWLGLASSIAGAQIYEWRDATGARNFTNDLEDVPLDQRDAARIVVRASPSAATPAELNDGIVREVAEPKSAARVRRGEDVEAPRMAQVIYDNSFRFARSRPVHQLEPQQPGPTVNVNIAGPLAVSQILVPHSVAAPVDAYGYYGFGGRIPLGLRPEGKDSRSRRRTNTSPGSVLSPAPLSPGSPAYMPAMRNLNQRPVARR